jgi:site-specific DNA recombinase
MTKNGKSGLARETKRCALYTRKSTEEGLEQEFNSLDAQREAGEAYVRSQQEEGWICLPTHYDDGGFSGGNLDRPALQRLLTDIGAGLVDCVIVYKVDRLSRSLLDFARIMEIFERHGVSFVSVTQAFHTGTSMGRLLLNVLLSFAQFERELVSERTHDKIAATRRKGKWAGGHPVLGYDINPQGFKLIINEEEAIRVRAIFALYLELEGVLSVVQELIRRGWVNKCWTTRKGRERGGRPFTVTSLHKLLINVTYLGKVRYKNEVHQGEHAAIVDPLVWQRVQSLMQRNGRTGGPPARNGFGALLKGLLRCVPCGCAMTPAHTTRQPTRRYCYYTCSSAQKRGWKTCPSKSIPASEIERFVVDRIRCIGQDPTLLNETLARARAQMDASARGLESERHNLEHEFGRLHGEVRQIVGRAEADDNHAVDLPRLADLQERIRSAESRAAEIQEQLQALAGERVDEEEVARALAAFDPVWETLTPHEQARLVRLLVERVDYDGGRHLVSITFHPAGIKTLVDELARHHQARRA